MSFSSFLNSKRQIIKELIKELNKEFLYVSVLGVDSKTTSISANKKSSNINDDSEIGFVIKMTNYKGFYEYSIDDISDDVKSLANKIIDNVKIDESLKNNLSDTKLNRDEKLIKSFERKSDYNEYSEAYLLDYCTDLKNQLLNKSDKLVNAYVSIQVLSVSKLFISNDKELDQTYAWINGHMVGVYFNNEKMVQSAEGANSNMLSDVLKELPTKMDKLIYIADKLTKAKPIIPGVYDVITDPTITGLIAHEAFGHGVEMDQFVKDRALAKKYVGEYVASPIVNMYDGAASALSVASYFFDDDGILASNTQIIKDGILLTGISDLASASILNTNPTGNGRRESYKRKSYARMTNTFFAKGHDKLEDMIKSIKHGYMLFNTDNGMEDPKNWAIQCVCQYGIEIIDGKLTDNYVAPVVMSGYVPDLLKSITMISDDFKIEGAGYCGKGYKEWVRVSDGGPALKAKVKLA